jgi:hypothetical protein
MKALCTLALAAVLPPLLAACGGDADSAHGVAARKFLRGNEAFAVSVALEEEGSRPGGDPEALRVAEMRAEDALAFWQSAATTRADWPEARRNVERALLRLQGLREKRGGRKPPDAPPRPEPPPPEPPEEEPPPAPDPSLQTAELPPGRVLDLLDLLRAREDEKRAARRAWRRTRSADVEKDW